MQSFETVIYHFETEQKLHHIFTTAEDSRPSQAMTG